MKESVGKYFVINHEIKENEYFDDTNIKDGNSIYEVLRIIDTIPLFFKEHITRFRNTAEGKGIKLNITDKKLQEDITKLILFNKTNEGNVKFIFNYNEEESVFMMYFIAHKYPNDKQYEEGVKTTLFYGERENPNLKIINNQFRNKVNQRIKNNEAYEAILIDRNKNITEGSKSNIFLIKNDILYTAPVEDVLPGVTRNEIIKVAKSLDIEVVEKNIKESQIKELDALFISGTSPKILPISFVDDIRFDSSNNTIVQNLIKEFENFIIKDINNFKEELVVDRKYNI